MSDRFRPHIAVFTALLKDDEVLLARRQNTGFMDGFYEFPAGHLEPRELLVEAVAREVLEETGIVLKPEDVELFHVNHNYITPEKPYINFMFRAVKWHGTPAIKEPLKCDDLRFFRLDALPSSLAPHVKIAVANIHGTQITYSELD